jgi:hypothetical protein
VVKYDFKVKFKLLRYVVVLCKCVETRVCACGYTSCISGRDMKFKSPGIHKVRVCVG